MPEPDYQAYLAWTYFGENALDQAEFERLGDTVGDATRFIDVGASHGVFTYHVNKILEDSEIIAIEADPERFRILEGNAEKWAAESSNTIRCINAAASDEQDRAESPEVTFFTTGTQISGGLFSVEERSGDYKPTTVPLVCVDDFFKPDERTVVKIDVEGAELRVLKGATKHTESGTTRFFTEVSWWGDRDRRTTALHVLAFCYRSGFRADRRLRSDYLMAPESSRWARLSSIIRCVPPLLLRTAYNTLVPRRVRLWRERRENERRLARYGD